MKKNLRKVLSLVLCVAVMLATCSQIVVVNAADSAEGTVTDGVFTYVPTLKDDGAVDYYTITACNDTTSTELTFPGEYNGIPVKIVNRNAYVVDKTQLQCIKFSEGIEELNADGASMFNSVTTSVYFPSTLKRIIAKFNNTRLENVYIADLNAWCNVDIIVDMNPNIYSKTSKLYGPDGNVIENLVIPESVETVKKYVFNGCASIKSITMGENVKHIEHWAFSGCNNTEDITLPDTVIHIETGAFDTTSPFFEKPENQDNGIYYIGKHLVGDVWGSDYLGEELIIREGTIDIADYALHTGEYPTGERPDMNHFTKLYIPNSVKRIGEYAFHNGVFTDVSWGSNVEYIGANAFYKCEKMEEIILNEGLSFIGDTAFAGCDSVKKLHIPSTVISFGELTFGHMPELVELTCAATNPAFRVRDNVLYSKDMKKVLLAANTFTEYVLPQQTVEIGTYAFVNNTKMENAILHDNVERIEEFAFELTKLYQDNTDDLKYVGKYLIAANGSNVYIKDGTLGVAAGVFTGNVANEITVRFPESIKFIEGDFTNVTSIDIQSVAKWFNVKHNNENLNRTLINAKLTLNGEPIRELVIPEGVKTVKAYLAGDCSDLEVVKLPGSVQYIQYNAFYNCPVDLLVHCLNGSYGHDFAINNDFDYYVYDVLGNNDSEIDYDNNVIVTGNQLIDDILSLIYVTGNKSNFVLGSMYVNGAYIFGTGSTITIYQGNERTEYTLVVQGDTNGDGVCDVLDAAQVGNYVNGVGDSANYHSTYAADSDGDGVVGVMDYSSVVNKALS